MSKQGIMTIEIARSEGAALEPFTATYEEVDSILNFLDEILPPVRGGSIRLPIQTTSPVWIYAIKIDNKIWDAHNGWSK